MCFSWSTDMLNWVMVLMHPGRVQGYKPALHISFAALNEVVATHDGAWGTSAFQRCSLHSAIPPLATWLQTRVLPFSRYPLTQCQTLCSTTTHCPTAIKAMYVNASNITHDNSTVQHNTPFQALEQALLRCKLKIQLLKYLSNSQQYQWIEIEEVENAWFGINYCANVSMSVCQWVENEHIVWYHD